MAHKLVHEKQGAFTAKMATPKRKGGGKRGRKRGGK